MYIQMREQKAVDQVLEKAKIEEVDVDVDAEQQKQEEKKEG
jgi:hypothetical protein